MLRRSSTIGLLALAALPLIGAPRSLAAQDDEEGPRVFAFSSGRPRIGVSVDFHADKDRDRLGARIESVTPDGPADKAGLKAGDIVTKFKGVSLGGATAEDEDESGPARKLVELARKLEPGDTVDVEYLRGGDTRTARIVARDLSGSAMGHGFRYEMPKMPRLDSPGGLPRMPVWDFDGPGSFRVFMDRDGMGLRLADLNPELGEYFGAKSGVLVLESPRDSTLPLKAGDVILSIDGRAPASEAHARRILASYDAGETAKLEIMRKQKKLTVSWKVPEQEGKWRMPDRRERTKIERS